MYLHIPFCRKKCGCCAFFSVPYSSCDAGGYIRRMAEDISMAADLTVPTIYIGGGDPGMLSADDLSLLLDALSPYITGSSETTIEMNPEHLTDSSLDCIISHGVDRISFGIQSFDPNIRRILGREGNIDRLKESLLKAAAHKELQLNADFITSVPGTEPDDTLRDIDSLLEICTPEHISLYDLALEDNTPLSRRYRETSLKDHLTPAWKYLKQLGYRHYELSNFSLEGREGQHNLRYWRLENYIGIGCSAVSGLVFPDHILRFTGIRDVQGFIMEGMHGAEAETVTSRDALKDLIMVSLRTEFGIPMQRIRSIYGDETADAVEQCSEKWESAGMMQHHALLEQGMLIMDTVVLDFFSTVEELDLDGTVRPLDSFF